MQPLNAPFGETWELLNGTRDRDGDRTLAVIATMERCVYWQNTAVGPGGGYPAEARSAASLTGTLAVLRGTTVPVDSRVRRISTGQIYQVIGPPEFDHVHPQTGWDTGYMALTVKAVAR